MPQATDERHFHSISRENNMNAVRYYLVLCIVLSHFVALSGEHTLELPRLFGGAGSFFALSGFLMFSSFEKHRHTRQFLVRRARRILPPYVFVVLAAAVGCSLVSSLPACDYFTSAGFWKYLLANLSFLNFLSPTLPGVFTPETTPTPSVNGALWTMKGEIVCYLSVPLAYRLLLRRPERIGRHLLLIVCGLGLLCVACHLVQVKTGHNVDVLRRQFLVMTLFYVGAGINFVLPLFHRYRYAVLAVCATLLMSTYRGYTPFPARLEWLYYCLVNPFVSGSMVIVCTITGTWGKRLSHHDSITYDIYLVHYPVIQLVLHFGLVRSLGPYPALLLCIVLSAALAYLVNRYVSRPFLAR